VIVDYYRNLRIDVNAVQADDRWNAEVPTLRLFSQDKRHVERSRATSCGRTTPSTAPWFGRGAGLIRTARLR